MAIAFDNAAYLGIGTGVSSFSASYTTSGSDRILHVGVFVTGNGGSDVLTSATYAGVSLTRINTQVVNFENIYLYELVAPASGANNVVISFSAPIGGIVIADAISHTGAAQSTQPDAQNTGTATGTSLSTSVTTTADNCWMIMYARSSVSDQTPAAGTTFRSGINNTLAMYDSNGPDTPPGSFSLGVTVGSSQVLAQNVLSISPVSASFATTSAVQPSGLGSGGLTRAILNSGVGSSG